MTTFYCVVLGKSHILEFVFLIYKWGWCLIELDGCIVDHGAPRGSSLDRWGLFVFACLLHHQTPSPALHSVGSEKGC